MRLISRVHRLEHDLRVRECPECGGKGKLEVGYKAEHEPDPVPVGCPGCGKAVHVILCWQSESHDGTPRPPGTPLEPQPGERLLSGEEWMALFTGPIGTHEGGAP